MVMAKPPAGGAKSAAVLAAEEAASAARAAASAAEARAAAMEKNIEALRQEAKANRESLARLTQALQEAQGASSTPLALWGALTGLGALSALLLVRMRRLQRGAGQAPWWSSASAEEALSPQEQEAVAAATKAVEATPMRVSDAPATPVASDALPQLESFEPSPAGARRELPPLPMPELDDGDVGEMERTQLLPPSASSVSAPIQGVSIEELLDLEQQVEFFTVLGQDDAALGLLVDHLRHTGGTYPLPYLKLLEIYRRKGDEESYERTRDRFNQRFNAVAPAWGAAPSPERHLEDLPDVMLKIEQAWPRPVDAMALLENMLVRTEGGTLLELSALAEVLFLFTLARDLHEQEAGAAGPVDVLLPLDDFMDLPAAPAAAPQQPATQQPAPRMSAGPQGVDSRDYPATQFASSSFALLEEASRQQASESSAADDSDHFDIPLGEPMFEPVFDQGTDDRGSSAREVPRADDLASPPPAWSGAIDLPSFGDGDQNLGLNPPAVSGRAAEPLNFDLSLPDDNSVGSSVAPKDSAPLLEALSFELPDLDDPEASAGAKAKSAGAVDLDISLDGLELEPLAPKLSPREEQAASNFGLFNDAPAGGKPR